MSEMVERVARAIAREYSGYESDYPAFEAAARAAIKAMREPTKAMESAGDNLDDWGVPSDPGSGNASALAHWHAMINAALVEK